MAHRWAKQQNPAKNLMRKIREIREIDWSYLCRQLFDKVPICRAETEIMESCL